MENMTVSNDGMLENLENNIAWMFNNFDEFSFAIHSDSYYLENNPSYNPNFFNFIIEHNIDFLKTCIKERRAYGLDKALINYLIDLNNDGRIFTIYSCIGHKHRGIYSYLGCCAKSEFMVSVYDI